MQTPCMVINHDAGTFANQLSGILLFNVQLIYMTTISMALHAPTSKALAQSAVGEVQFFKSLSKLSADTGHEPSNLVKHL